MREGENTASLHMG